MGSTRDLGLCPDVQDVERVMSGRLGSRPLLERGTGDVVCVEV